MPFVATWMDLEIIILSKITQKDKYHIISLIVTVAQSCPTLCDPMDYTVHGILQARILEWVAFPFRGILPTQGLNPGIPNCRRILCQLSHNGSPITYMWNQKNGVKTKKMNLSTKQK